jgi:hypothetical protein
MVDRRNSNSAPQPIPECDRGGRCATTTALSERQHAHAIIMGARMAGIERELGALRGDVTEGFKAVHKQLARLDERLDAIREREAERKGAEAQRQKTEDRAEQRASWLVPWLWHVAAALIGAAALAGALVAAGGL